MMARTAPGVTRERILDVAVRLFATKGYAATSVVDIQVASGLTAGSGALYKHFPSKKALLEAAVQRNLDRMAERSREVTVDPPDDPRDALRVFAAATWDVIGRDRELVRLMLREFDGFPALFERMWQGVVADVYVSATAWITAEVRRGTMRVADPEATAAVLLGSLTYYPLLQILIGHSPGDVPADRFVEAWVASAAATLGLP